jgi:hypothetical protein
MHRRSYPTQELLYDTDEREAKATPPAKATPAQGRTETGLGAARGTARGRGAQPPRLHAQAGCRSSRREHLDDRPTRRSLHQHREDALGPETDPRPRTRAVSAGTRRNTSARPPAWCSRSTSVLVAASRRPYPPRLRARPQPRRHRAGAQRGRNLDRARRPPLVAVDRARGSRPLHLNRSRRRASLARSGDARARSAPGPGRRRRSARAASRVTDIRRCRR